MPLQDPTGGIKSKELTEKIGQTKEKSRKLKDPTGGIESVEGFNTIMRPLSEFDIKVNSRWAGSLPSYNRKTHRYDLDYIRKPISIRIFLDARSALGQLTSPPPASQGGKFSPGQGFDNSSIDSDGTIPIPEPLDSVRPELELPDGILAYEWHVEKVGGGFSTTVVNKNDLPPTDVARAVFDVPGEGEYSCSLTVRGKNNFTTSQTHTIKIKEYLIVSIGASYGSGQGNPDIPGKPDLAALAAESLVDLTTITDTDTVNWFENDLPFFSFVGDVVNKALSLAFDPVVDWVEIIGNWFATVGAPTVAAKFEKKLPMDPEPFWLEPQADRSMRSGHALGAAALEKRRPGEEKILVTYLNFCREGSTIPNGILNVRGQDFGFDSWIGKGQIDELKEISDVRPIDALIIDIGGNDVGFSSYLKKLVKESEILHEIERDFNKDLEKLKNDRFPKLLNRLKPLRIHDIFLTEYPYAMFEKMVGGKPTVQSACEAFALEGLPVDIKRDEADAIFELGKQLNTALKEIADANKWVYVDGIADGFAGRGYCEKESIRFYRRIAESFVLQGDYRGGMHPNRKGHEWIGKQVGKHLRERVGKSTKNFAEPVGDGKLQL